MTSQVQLADSTGNLVDATHPVPVTSGAYPIGTATVLLNAVTVTGAGTASQPKGAPLAFSASGTTSAGTGAATIAIEASISGTTFFSIGTISLTLGTSATADGFGCLIPYPYIRGNVTAISGTNATVTVRMAV